MERYTEECVREQHLLHYVFEYDGVATGSYMHGFAPGANNSTTTAALVAGVCYFWPLIVPTRVEIDAVGIQVTTAEAGKFCEVAVYEYDRTDQFQPGAQIATSGALNIAAIGIKIGTFSDAWISPGKYWWGFSSDSAGVARWRGCAIENCNPIQGIAASTQTYTALVGVGAVYPLPDPAPAMVTGQTDRLPNVCMRKA